MKMRIIAVLLLGFLLALALTGIAVAQSNWCSQITISTTTGTPGTAVNVSGFAYESSYITVLWDGMELASAPATVYDDYSIDFNVPADALPGDHEVTVVIEYEGTDECPIPFVVEAMATEPEAETPAATMPVARLPETGLMLVPAGALLAAGLGLFASRKRRG